MTEAAVAEEGPGLSALTLRLPVGFRRSLEKEAEALGIGLSRLVRQRLLSPPRELEDLHRKLELAEAQLAASLQALHQAETLLLHYSRLLGQAQGPGTAGGVEP